MFNIFKKFFSAVPVPPPVEPPKTEASVRIKQAAKAKSFAGHDRKGAGIDRITMHEPAVATLDSTVKILQNKGLSVHYCIDRDGSITQHCPIERYTAHAGIPGQRTGHNLKSVGLEFINRYYGHRVDQVKELKLYSGKYAARVVPGIWVDRAWSAKEKRFLNPGRLYIFPTAEQLEAGWCLVRYLLVECGLQPNVKEWSGVSKTLTGKEVYNWTTVRGHDSFGVKAHAMWAHADGRVPHYYTLLRSRGIDAAEAFELTLQAATSLKKQTRLPAR